MTQFILLRIGEALRGRMGVSTSERKVGLPNRRSGVGIEPSSLSAAISCLIEPSRRSGQRLGRRSAFT
jgi:hypothetical protein